MEEYYIMGGSLEIHTGEIMMKPNDLRQFLLKFKTSFYIL